MVPIDSDWVVVPELGTLMDGLFSSGSGAVLDETSSSEFGMLLDGVSSSELESSIGTSSSSSGIRLFRIGMMLSGVCPMTRFSAFFPML